ncbi:MAG: CHAT domain-containing protein [Bacteroidales bacterium]|nr:CHAT domain-containing protein [Bacteroidales bacterium]
MERRLFFYLILILLLLFPWTPNHAQGDSLKIIELNARGRKLAGIGDFDGAVQAFQSILEIDSNSFTAMNNLGRVYKMLGRYNDALTVLQKAAGIVIRECGVDCSELAHIYINIGNIYNGKQDYELALQYFNYTERIVQVNSMTRVPATSVYNNIGNVYYHMEEWRKALNSYLKSVEMKKRVNSGGLDISYANCASSYENLGIYDSARMYYNWAIRSKIEQYGENSHHLISVYNNYSLLLQKLEENAEAYRYLSRALELAQNKYSEKHPLISESHRFLGEWYLSMGQPDSALIHLHKAVLAVVYDFDSKNVFVNPSPEGDIISESALLNALRGKARAFEDLYEQTGEMSTLVAALETLEISNLLTEKMRSSYLGQESKLFIAETSHRGLSSAINIAYRLYELSGDTKYAHQAFTYAEKSKSSVLLASLQEVENKRNLGIPAEMQVFEEDLKSERETYKKKLYEERQREMPDSSRLGIWQGKLIELSQQLDSINMLIREKYPEYASKYDNDVISMANVKEGLSDEQALIEYSFSDTSMFVFLLGRDTEYFIRIRITGDFHENITLLSRFLRNNDFDNSSFDDYLAYTDAAYSLYQTLLQPLEDKISGNNLIIIPDGELGYIPFEALLTAESDKNRMDYRSLPYLIYKFVTNYSYSATLHFESKQNKKASERQLLAFAPTYEHVADINAEKFPTFRNYSDVLVPLRFISKEIENIGNIMEADTYEGHAATEKTFREEAPRYDILHLAMHTLINDENPMYSQLVFSLNNDTLEDNDGLLNTYELFNIHLSARMAVLSACNTGYGQLRQGEGVMSLARGFIFAGVPSIIMTLWAVEDQSGSILMSSFYENLVSGQNIDVALRESKLQYLMNADQLSAHPYLWSGYVSIGSTAPLTSGGPSTISILVYAFIAAMVLGIFLFVWLRRRKKA